MIGWKLFFCLLVGLLIESPLMSADSYEPQKKIGVEIETSWVKVKDMGDIIPSFSMSHGGKKLWLLEPDTVDSLLSSSSLRNLELKTYPGFENQATFLDLLDEMSDVLKNIHLHKKNEFTTKDLQQILAQAPPKEIDFSGASYMDIEQKSSDGHIRPQITYQLPLSMIPKVFERLKELGHEGASTFWNALNNDVFKDPKLPRQTRYPSIQRLWKEDYEAKMVLIKLRQNFRVLKEKMPENVKGMTYLFLYYWASLFNGKNSNLIKEPGLKPYLAVMSRIPLSQLYDHGLQEHEKAEFKEVVGKVVEEVGGEYKLRAYIKAKGTKVEPSLTLKEWYFSIINHGSHRQSVEKRLGDEKQTAPQEVDSLSPPPELDRFNSMGLFAWDATQSPLIEVRGYATIFEAGVAGDKTPAEIIGTVNKFIREESQWFFNN